MGVKQFGPAISRPEPKYCSQIKLPSHFVKHTSMLANGNNEVWHYLVRQPELLSGALNNLSYFRVMHM